MHAPRAEAAYEAAKVDAATWRRENNGTARPSAAPHPPPPAAPATDDGTADAGGPDATDAESVSAAPAAYADADAPRRKRAYKPRLLDAKGEVPPSANISANISAIRS